MRRSSSAAVKRSEANTVVHSSNGQVAGNDDRSSFVALTEDFEQQLCASRRERDVAQFIDDKKPVTSELTLEAQ